MAKHPKPDEIVAKLRQADVLTSQSQSVAYAIRARRELGDALPVAERVWLPEVKSGSTDEVSVDGKY